MLLVSDISVGDDEKNALAKVIDSQWLTMGNRVRAFELAFAAVHNVDDAVAVSSCTAGLHLALAAMEIGPGDEVLVPSLSFVATANAVVYAGATPVFVDVQSLNAPLISLADAAAKLTPKTRAVIVMHYAGHLVDGAAWCEFARQHGLVLIEDSAHAVGAGRLPIFGDLAVFSFYGNKNMTTAEGGMVVARRPEVLARVRLARSHGMTTSAVDRLLGHAMYDVKAEHVVAFSRGKKFVVIVPRFLLKLKNDWQGTTLSCRPETGAMNLPARILPARFAWKICSKFSRSRCWSERRKHDAHVLRLGAVSPKS